MAKRGQNEGSIYQREDGRWCAQVNLGYVNGKRKRKYIYGATRREVAAKLKKVLHEQQQGLPVAVERQTVAQFLEGWLTDVVKREVEPKTYHSYAQVVKLYLNPVLGRHQLAALAPQHIQAMMNQQLADGLAPRTVQYARAVLRAALGQALRWGLVPRNVAALVDPPKSRRYEPRPLNPAQASRFLEAIRSNRLEALFTVGVALGLRPGEMFGLRWEDVDFDAKTLRVRKELQRIDGRPQLKDLKTDRSRRTLPMPSITVAALRTQRVRQNEERLLAGSRWQDWGLVFTSTIGTPLDARNVTSRYKAVLTRTGLPDIRFYDLRHSCASLLIAQGVPLAVVSRILGHSQISLTMNTYVHLFPEVQQQAADAMDDLFGSTFMGGTGSLG